MAEAGMDLRHGMFESLILTVPVSGPLCGRDIAKWIEGVSDGVHSAGPGSPHPACCRPEDDGLAVSERGRSPEGPRAKPGTLTDAGRERFAEGGEGGRLVIGGAVNGTVEAMA